MNIPGSSGVFWGGVKGLNCLFQINFLPHFSSPGIEYARGCQCQSFHFSIGEVEIVYCINGWLPVYHNCFKGTSNLY